MAQPKLRCRRKLPPLPVRVMDLVGVGKDGGLYLWQGATQVQPVSTFERNGEQIEAGHYVIEHRGAAVTVHCSNTAWPGCLSVLFMCGGLETVLLSRKAVESTLLGKVIRDAKADAEISAALQRLIQDEEARQTAPHLRRGKL